MRRALAAAAAVCLCLSLLVPLQAQQAGSNVGILPVVADPADPDAYLKGDLYLQRQLEPSLAVSTRNPQTLIAFFNDYRAVDVPGDLGLGEGSPETGWTLLAWARPLTRFFARLAGRELRARPKPIAAAEAWIGMSRSYDGGRTWQGGFLPGASFDQAPASLDSPARGKAAATDPVVAAGPCGQFYVAFLAFNRGADSHLAVARYVDRNNSEGGDNIAYLGTTIVDDALNASKGQFLDKPSIAVDTLRAAGSDPCGQNVYVSYTQFTGKSGSKFQSQIMFARSTDGGVTFTRRKLSESYPQNQGTAIAVDPRPGTPATTGGGSVYVVWRHFFDPDAMIAQKSVDFGASWLNQGVRITSDTLQRFDQPTQATSMFPPEEIAFRTNAFPTVAVTSSGRLLAAWQERVDVSSDPQSPTFGRPAAGGSPRIVMTSSADGISWTPRRAIDFGDRDAIPPAPGGGLLPQPRPSGPQVMPSLSSGGGRVMLAYYESRGFFQTWPSELIVPADITGSGGFIAGMDRLMDVRAAVLDPATGAIQGTAQVSRYPIKSWASLGNGEQLDDVLPVNLPCSPDFGPGLPACVRRVNRTNLPHSAAGTSPFIGDYVHLAPAVQFVRDSSGWRWATAADVPDAGFHAAFADNRNIVPPTSPSTLLEWQRYPHYSPPAQGGSCVNGGSRNTDVVTSRVGAQLVVSAPTTFKQLGTIQRAFPLSVANGTGSTKFYRLSLAAGADSASFSQGNPGIDSGDVQLFPYSSTTRVVYVSPTAAGFIVVQVEEIDSYGGAVVSGGLSGTATINADSSNPEVAFSDPTTETHDPFVQNPFVQNPFVQNPFVQNPFVQNTSPANPFVQNPFVQNPFVQNVSPEDVVDVTWTVQNVGNTASTYLASVNVDNAAAYIGNYAWQLIVWKQSSNGGLRDCSAVNEGQAEIIANVVQNPFVQNPFVQNPFVQNPFVQNPFVQNPVLQNSTFAIAPADSTDTPALRTTADPAAAAADGTTRQPRARDEIKVTLRAFRINRNSPVVFDPVVSPPSLAVTSETKNIVQGTVGDDVPTGYVSPDLVISGGVGGPLEVSLGSSFVFPASGFSVVNQANAGGAAVDGTTRHAIYLSADSTITPGDMLLGYVTATGPIEPGQSQSFAGQPVAIPAGVTGDYYIGVLADDQLEVSELDETNNWSSVPILIRGNTPPVAASQSVTTAYNTPVSITLAGTDADGDPLTFVIADGPAHGTLSGTGASRVYTPAAGYSGSDSFAFTAHDGVVDSAPATVSIFVTFGSLTLTKTAAPATYSGVAQTITYTYGVTNSGNIPLSGTLSIADDRLGTIGCGTVTLAPGAATTCTKTYKTTQGDIDARAITNAATAVLAGVTSNRATRTVTSTVINGRLRGAKYYDGARNGLRDPSDPGVGSWRINVFSGSKLLKTIATAPDGTFAIALAPGSYRVQEATAQSAWTQTGNLAGQFTASGMTVALTGGSYSVTIPSTVMSDATGLDFGNACSIVPGGLSQGFWASRNGASLIGSADLQALRDLPLVNGDGSSFDPASVAEFQAWLSASATGQNMADQLSGQLAALQLNLRHGYTNPIATVDGTRTTTAQVGYASSLIAADPFTPSADPNRAEQERVKTLIMDVNSGSRFWQTLPDACPAPIWK
jgi:hypothetical protein